MKCRRTFVTLFFCFFVVSSWAQESLVESDTSVSSHQPAEAPPPISQQLRSLATTIEQATTDSEADWDQLLQEWTTLSGKLEELATLSADSEREMQSIKELQKASEKLLMDSIKAREKAEASERFWKALGIGGLVVGLVSGGTGVIFYALSK